MGACVSTPQSCVGGKFSSLKKKKSRKRRRYGLGRRVPSRLSEGSLENIDMNGLSNRSFTNPIFQGSIEEVWFDSVAVLDSDYDDDYQSVPDDFASLNGVDVISISSFPSSRDASHGVSTDQLQKPVELSLSTGYSANISESSRSSNIQPAFSTDDVGSQSKQKGSISEINQQPVFLDEISSVDANSNKEDGLLDNCGIIPNNCLPCLASNVPSFDKRRLSSSSPPDARKKAPLKLPFKWKEGHANATLFLSKILLQRPVAGSQVPFCPIEKKMFDCWSQIDPETFRVRGVNYFR